MRTALTALTAALALALVAPSGAAAGPKKRFEERDYDAYPSALGDVAQVSARRG